MSTTSSSSNANSTSKVGLASSTPSSPTTLPPAGHDSPNRGFGALPPTPTNQQNNKSATPQVGHSTTKPFLRLFPLNEFQIKNKLHNLTSV